MHTCFQSNTFMRFLVLLQISILLPKYICPVLCNEKNICLFYISNYCTFIISQLTLYWMSQLQILKQMWPFLQEFFLQSTNNFANFSSISHIKRKFLKTQMPYYYIYNEEKKINRIQESLVTVFVKTLLSYHTFIK